MLPDLDGFIDYLKTIQLSNSSQTKYRHWFRKASKVLSQDILSLPQEKLNEIIAAAQFKGVKPSQVGSVINCYRDYVNKYASIGPLSLGKKEVNDDIARRRGRGRFRKRVVNAYAARCAVTGCEFDVLLEAAHIIPFSQSQSNMVSNGILLRADVHLLFDLGMLSINPTTGKVHCKKALLKHDYYKSLHGTVVKLPSVPEKRPDLAKLLYHFRKIARFTVKL